MITLFFLAFLSLIPTYLTKKEDKMDVDETADEEHSNKDKQTKSEKKAK